MTARLPLLLIPGLVNDARLWQGQLAALEDRAEARVADITGADSMAALASAVLAQAPLGGFALAGLSMGGYVAFEIMRQAPERVLALALLDTSARPDTEAGAANRRKAMAQAEADFDAVVEAMLPKMVHAAHLEDAAVAGVFRAMARSVGKDAYLRQQRAILGRIDSRPTLAAIRCPTLVLCGRDDALTPVGVHEEMAAGIAGARLLVVEQAGHLSPLDQPQAVAQAMVDWLHG